MDPLRHNPTLSYEIPNRRDSRHTGGAEGPKLEGLPLLLFLRQPHSQLLELVNEGFMTKLDH
jgi:hypothetical protein